MTTLPLQPYVVEAPSRLMIEILLACASPYKGMMNESIWTGEQGVTIRRWLVNEGMIDSYHNLLERGKVWLEGIINTPLPVEETVTRWVMPTRGEEEDED